MVLCESKRDAIIQWHNAVTQNNISTLKQLQDGYILQKHVKDIFNQSSERAVATSSKNINFFKEADSKASFAFVKQYIDVSCRMESDELIRYEECMLGVELELAKAAVLTLAVTTTQLLQLHREEEDPRLGLLYQLDVQVQKEICECMSFVMDCPVPRTSIAFDRILSRSVTITQRYAARASYVAENSAASRPGTPRPGTPRPGTPHLVTPAKKASTTRPRGRPPKFADYETAFGDDEPKILLQLMESPEVRAWSNMARKEREFQNLRNDLDVAENKIVDQRYKISQLREDVVKKNDEVEKWKKQCQTLQKEMEERDLSMDARNHSMEGQIGSSNMWESKIENYEKEIAELRAEVERQKEDSDDLRSKLERYREKEALNREQLAENVSQYQSMRSERDSLAAEVQRLGDEMKEMKDTIVVYKEKLQEKDKAYESILTEYSSPEILGDILEEDSRATREKLLREEVQNAHLRRLLEEKTADCERQQALLESGPARTETEDKDKATSAMNEIAQLAERVFAAHGEGPPPESPGESGGLAEDFRRAKRLLGELLLRRSPRNKRERFETKSDEASLDSGMCAASDPGSLPSSGEEEPRRPDPLAPAPQDPYEEALKAKEECERAMEDLSKQVDSLTWRLNETSSKLEEREKTLAFLEFRHQRTVKKYAKLKEYTLGVEQSARDKAADLMLLKGELKPLREQLAQCKKTEKELRAREAQNLELRESSSRVRERLRQEKEQLELKVGEMSNQLQIAKLQVKQLTAKFEEENQRWQFGCEVEIDRRGDDHAEQGHIRMKMFSTENGSEAGPSSRGAEFNESVLSGNHFNKSLHSTLVTEDEELFVHHTPMPNNSEADSFEEQKRLQELAKRNSIYKPHLRSTYALETQGYKKGAEGMVDEETAPPKKVARTIEVPKPKPFRRIFRTPHGLSQLVQRRESEKKRKMGIKRPRLKTDFSNGVVYIP